MHSESIRKSATKGLTHYCIRLQSGKQRGDEMELFSAQHRTRLKIIHSTCTMLVCWAVLYSVMLQYSDLSTPCFPISLCQGVPSLIKGAFPRGILSPVWLSMKRDQVTENAMDSAYLGWSVLGVTRHFFHLRVSASRTNSEPWTVGKNTQHLSH